jgi:hypothetical protein
MADNVLESYLIRLGSTVDVASFVKFDSVLGKSGNAVVDTTTKIVKEFAKVEFGIVNTFSAIGLGLIAMADKTAMADQNYRLFGLRMLMSTQQARSFQMALDNMGVSMDDLVDPEINKRFNYLIGQYQRLGKALGPGFEDTQKQVRLLRDEFGLFKDELAATAWSAVSKLFEKMGYGGGDLLTIVRHLNDELMINIPRWSDEASTALVPIWKDVVKVMGGAKDSAEAAGLAFTNIIGTLSGDDAIKGTTFDADKLGKALDHVADALANIATWGEKAFSWTVHLTDKSVQWAVALAEASQGDFMPLQSLMGTHPLTSVEQAAGGAWQSVKNLPWQNPFRPHALPPVKPQPASTTTAAQTKPVAAAGQAAWSLGATTETMKTLALDASQKTGIPANLIFEQWAHETGGFTSDVFKRLGNAGGIEQGKDTSGNPIYRSYATPQAFESDYLKTITNQRYTSQGIRSAKTEQEFAAALKLGGYYEDSYSNYLSGMQGFRQMAVTVGVLNVNLPPGTPQDHAQQIVDTLRDVHKTDTRRLVAQTAGGPY